MFLYQITDIETDGCFYIIEAGKIEAQRKLLDWVGKQSQNLSFNTKNYKFRTVCELGIISAHKAILRELPEDWKMLDAMCAEMIPAYVKELEGVKE